MKISYDAEADGLTIRLADGQYFESEEVHPGFVLDFDEDGRVLGFEVLPASKVLGPGAWSTASPRAASLEAAE